MRTIKTTLLLLLALLLAGACFTAHADETGCRAIITTLSGEKMQVSQFAVRLLEDASPSTALLVFYDGGQSILDLGKLRRLTRLAPAQEAKKGTKVEFAFEASDGQTGKFKIWWNYIFSGQTQIGAWSERVAKIKQVEVNCPPPDLSPPASAQ